MCLLCDDEKAYQAYMNYLDAMERQAKETGKAADPEAAVNAVLDQLQAEDARAAAKAKLDDPKNDKTLSPFFCSPINK
jgi:predicted RNase H-like nuclease (RuvC/YqgF family)